MSKIKTRRETLSIIGAAGITALVGCGDEPGGTGATGPATSGTTGGTGGTGGAGSGGAGGGGGSGTGSGGSAGAGGSGTGGGGAGGGTGGGGAGGGTGGGGTGGSGGGAGGGTGGGGAAGRDGGTGGSGTGGTGTDGGAGTGGSAGRDGGGGGGSGGSGGGDAGPVQCKSKQETTVGPYPNIDPLDRRDVRGNTKGTTTPKEGVQLTLRMRVFDLDNGCAPIAGAVVDIWACDAVGDYAGYSAFGTTGQDFCRGYQKTDDSGAVEFLTIFPGSYTGRAIHIHFSLQGMPKNLSPNGEGSSMASVFVAQLYFTKAIADEVFAAMPIYKQGAAITPNESDSIYGMGGKDLIVKMTKMGSGYLGEVDVGVRKSGIGK